jgi:D-serine deaminase-like pyridoxal phosphate-dependent protein
VLAEVNVGLNRCGVDPCAPALDFVRRVVEFPGIDFRGLMGYEGGVFVKDTTEKVEICKRSNALLLETAELVRGAGIPVEVVSSGGSNTMDQTGLYPGITDIQVGSYVTMDSHNREFGIDFEQAIFVLSTIVSRQGRGRGVMDAGKKAFSCDAGMPGFVEQGIEITMLCEEHGILGISKEAEHLRIGDKVMVVPSHGCTTIPLYDEYIAVRGGVVESILPIRTRQTS